MKIDKDIGIHISLATVGALLPVLLAAWFLIKPAVVQAVGDELQEQVQLTVAKEVQPINSALAIMLQNNIASIQRQIASLAFQRDFPPAGDWTDSDAQDLANLQLDLQSTTAALAALATGTE